MNIRLPSPRGRNLRTFFCVSYFECTEIETARSMTIKALLTDSLITDILEHWHSELIMQLITIGINSFWPTSKSLINTASAHNTNKLVFVRSSETSLCYNTIQQEVSTWIIFLILFCKMILCTYLVSSRSFRFGHFLMDAKLLSFKSTPLFVASYVAKHVFETYVIPVAVVGCEQARPRGLEKSPTHIRQYFLRLAGGRDWG